jgi:hypothetical protein
MRRVGRAIVTALMMTMVAAGVAWSMLAVWFDGPPSRVMAGILAIAAALGSFTVAAKLRPLRPDLIGAIVPVVASGSGGPPFSQRTIDTGCRMLHTPRARVLMAAV